MTNKLVYLNDASFTPDNILNNAIGSFNSLVIIGYDNNGCIDVRSSTGLDHGGVLWLVETFKKKLLNGDYSE